MTRTPKSLPARGDSLKGEVARLEERLRHELMNAEERDRLRCRILDLKAGRS